MPTEAAVLISSLGINEWTYYNQFRPWVYQTIHFTTLKPWKGGAQSSNTFVCTLLREFKESIDGIEHYYDLIPPITNDYLVNCK